MKNNEPEEINELKDKLDEYKSEVSLALKRAEQLMNESIKQGVEINKILSIGNDMDKSNTARNEAVIESIKNIAKLIEQNKDQISESILADLNIQDIISRLDTYNTNMENAINDILDSQKSMTDTQAALQLQVKILLEQTVNLKRVTESFGLNVDYNRTVQDIIKFMKNKKGAITIEELQFRFSPSIVKTVLEAGEALGYWKFSFWLK